MANMLEQAAAWLQGTLAAAAPTPIVYRRGAYSVSITNAVVGATRFFVTDEEGTRVEYKSRDYLFAPSLLDFGNGPTEPKNGDRIEETIAGQTYVYQVVAMDGEQPWRWSDPYRKQFRVHTQHVATS